MTSRWSMVVFYNFLDVAALSAVLIYRHWHPQTKNINRFRNEKLIELAKQLMGAESITRQTCERNTVGKLAIDAFGFLGYNEPVLYPRLEERLPRKMVKARSHLCPRSADRKSGITCDLCDKNICSTHHSITCVKCDSEAKNGSGTHGGSTLNIPGGSSMIN